MVDKPPVHKLPFAPKTLQTEKHSQGNDFQLQLQKNEISEIQSQRNGFSEIFSVTAIVGGSSVLVRLHFSRFSAAIRAHKAARCGH